MHLQDEEFDRKLKKKHKKKDKDKKDKKHKKSKSKSKTVLKKSEWDLFTPMKRAEEIEAVKKSKKDLKKKQKKKKKPETAKPADGKFYSSDVSEIIGNLSPSVRKIVKKSVGDQSKVPSKQPTKFNRYYTGEWKNLY